MPFMTLFNHAPMRLQATLARTAWIILSATLVSGCSGGGAELAPVSGRVTLDGVPLAGARIRFQPEASDGSPSYGTADQDGHYELGYKRGQPGALIGWHIITVERGGHGGSENKAKPQALPARYNTASELREEVKADEDNVVDLELTTSEK